MKEYNIGDYFVLRSVNDLKPAAKKLEDDGHQVFADDSQATRYLVRHTVSYLISRDGFAALGLDGDGDVVVAALGFFSRQYAALCFGGGAPKERPLIGWN